MERFERGEFANGFLSLGRGAGGRGGNVRVGLVSCVMR